MMNAKPAPFADLLRDRSHSFALCRTPKPTPLAATVLLAFLFVAIPESCPILAAAGVNDEKPTAHAPNDGFTRESMAALGQPDPTPVPSGPIVSHRVAVARMKSPRIHRTRVDSKDFVTDGKDIDPDRGKVRSAASKRVAAHGHTHGRNPVVSFVYWWNGFVIKTFHTKIGTVMYRRIGAKI